MESIEMLNKKLGRARIVAKVLSTVCILVLIFAIMQKLEAERNYNQILVLQKQLEETKVMAEQAKEEADRQRALAIMQAETARQPMEQSRKK